MKKTLYFFCYLFFLGFDSHGQWIRQNTHFPSPLRGIEDVCAVDANVVWAAAYDGYIIGNACQDICVTTNGGTLWTPLTVGGASGTSIANICAISATEAWTCHYSASWFTSNQGVWHTTDGGVTWTHQTSAEFSNILSSFPNCVWFWNASNGYCAGDPVNGHFEIYTTTNGGNSWTVVPVSNIPNALSGEMGVVGYQSIVGNTVWFGTNKSRIFKSTDRGLNWTVATCTPIYSTYIKPCFKNETYGLIVNKGQYQTGALAMTNDGGWTFTPRNNTGNTFTRDMDYVPGSPATWVTTGADTSNQRAGVTYSFDDGATFNDMPLTIGKAFMATSWLNDSTAWAGELNNDASTGGMFKFNGHLVHADFRANNTNIGIGGQVSFICSVSTSATAAILWSFPGGNPASSTLKTPPPVTYSAAGQYNASLTITNNWGTTTELKNNFVTVSANPAPTVSFTANQTNIMTGEQVQFTDLTTGNPANWQWSFPGGSPTSSNLQTPLPVVYNTAGKYDVILTVSNANGSNTCTKIRYIVVVTPVPPVANFFGDPTSVGSGESVQFVDQSAGQPASWSWHFQGGTPATSSNQSPPAISYASAGQFDVTLVVSNVNGNDTETKAKYITVINTSPPVVNFYGDTPSIITGGSVRFTEITSGNPTSWEWTFPGGNPPSSFKQNPDEVFYNTPGKYAVSLKAMNQYGSTTNTKPDYITVTDGIPPVAHISMSTNSIATGHAIYFSDASTGDPTTYIWSFEGGSPSSSVAKQPDSIFYHSAGIYTVGLSVANAYGSNSLFLDKFIRVGSIGIHENDPSGVMIYPNPAREFLIVKSIKPQSEISLVNQYGIVIMKRYVDAKECRINVNDFPAGVYIIEITSGTGKTYKKVLISK